MLVVAAPAELVATAGTTTTPAVVAGGTAPGATEETA